MRGLPWCSGALASLLVCGVALNAYADGGANDATHAATKGRDRLHVGGYLSALGPAAFFGLGLSIQPLDMLELSGFYGLRWSSDEIEVEQAHASQHIIEHILLARARMWFFPDHSPLLDFGAGFGLFRISAEGSSSTDQALSLRRTGTPPIANLGAGYGYRSPSGLRLSFTAGAIIHGGRVDDPEVNISPGFDTGQKDALRSFLDQKVDPWLKPRFYADLSVGFFF